MSDEHKLLALPPLPRFPRLPDPPDVSGARFPHTHRNPDLPEPSVTLDTIKQLHAEMNATPWSRLWLLRVARRAVGSAYPADAIDVVSPERGLVEVRLRIDEPVAGAQFAWHNENVARHGADWIRSTLGEVPLGLELRVAASPCIEHEDCRSNADLGRACRESRLSGAKP